MKVGTEAQLAVKWRNQTWTYYRVSRHRNFYKMQDYFIGLANFSFAILYKWDKETKTRGAKLGYFSKKTSEVYF